MPRLLTTLSRFLSAFAARLRGGRPAPPHSVRPAADPRRRQAKTPPYDLEKDASTDDQKYLM